MPAYKPNLEQVHREMSDEMDLHDPGCEVTDEDREGAAEIDRLTCLFAESVDSALKQAREARGAVEKLMGEAYDCELAEGADGEDALAELDAALRALRNVARIASHRRSLMLADPRLKG